MISPRSSNDSSLNIGISIGDDATVPTSNLNGSCSSQAGFSLHDTFADDRILELIENLDWENLTAEIQKFPEKARSILPFSLEGCYSRGFPLHLAVSMKPPSQVIETLLEACPVAVKSREERWGRLPLHIACISKASTQVLQVLVEAHEESLRVTDKTYNRLPLHYACFFGSSPGISFLVNAEQRALVFKDGKGKTPVDLAKKSNNTQREAIVEMLGNLTMSVTKAIIQRKKDHEGPRARRRHSISYIESDRSRKNSPLKTSQSTQVDKKSKQSRRKSIGNDSDIGKKSKSIRRKRNSKSKNKETSNSFNGKLSEINAPTNEKKHKQKNTIRLSKSEKSLPELLRCKEKNLSRRKSHEINKISSLLKENGTNISSDEEDELDQKNEKTHKQKNGIHLSKALEEPSPEFQSCKKATQPRRNSCGLDSLSSFLKKVASNISSDEEDELDQKTRGVRSLPTFKSRSSSFTTAQSSLVTDNCRDQIEDSSKVAGMNEDGSAVPEEMHIRKVGSALFYYYASGVDETITELATLDDKIGHLEIERKNLMCEFDSTHRTMIQDEETIKQSRESICKLQQQITLLQGKLEKEQDAMSLDECCLEAKKGDLVIHEEKINNVTLEIKQYLEEKIKIQRRVITNEDK